MNLRSEKIPSNLFPDINWFTKIEHPPKRSTGMSLKLSYRFWTWFVVVNSNTPMKQRNSPNSITNPLILLFLIKRMTS